MGANYTLYLLRTAPEPASFALAGSAALECAVVGRRRK